MPQTGVSTSYDPVAGLHAGPSAGGPFVWHDLMSAQPARSVAFYRALFGWRAETRKLGPGTLPTYTSLHADAHSYGGVMPLDPRSGVRAHWVSYVCVDDVDAACLRAAAAGGRTCIPPTAIPHVGRFALLEDPSGAPFSLISLPIVPHIADPYAPPAPGTAWWHELAAPDPAAAAAFYRAVLGWRVRETKHPDGARAWLFMRGDVPMGRMRRLTPAAGGRPHWLVYVAVEDVDAVVARALTLGATPSFPCADVPGFGRVGGLVDPAGASIAVGRPIPA